MKPEEVLPIGEEVGCEAAERAAGHGENYCRHERQRIELTNKPKILALHARFAQLAELIESLKERIQRAPHPGEMKAGRHSTYWYRILATLLIGSSFCFLVFSFDPFPLGWKVWLYCLGLAVLTPFLLERAVEAWEARTSTLWRTIVTTACLAALAAHLLLSVVRGEIMKQQLSTPEPAVVIEGEAAPPSDVNNFYERSMGYLALTLVLFAFASELGAGAAWRLAKQSSNVIGEDRFVLEQELRAAQEQQVECGYAAAALAAEGAIFEETFRRDFDRAMLKRSRNGVLDRLVVASAILFFVGSSTSASAQKLNLVIAIDLSASVNVQGLDGKTDCDRNKGAVSKLLSKAPADSKITIVGITDRSFTSPYVLLEAQVDSEKGYFKERLSAARRRLVSAWRRRSEYETCRFRRTDLLGSLFVVGELIETRASERMILVVFSDMKHDMAEGSSAVGLEKHAIGSFLRSAEVYALGVSGSGSSPDKWQQLHTFWADYLRRAGATLRRYSMLRELPDLGQRD